jgi:multidrug efflux pump subunit AcrB
VLERHTLRAPPCQIAQGRPIRVGDVAEAAVTYKKPSGFVRSSGKPVIAINVQQEVGSNIVEVMDGVRSAIDELNGTGGLLAIESAQRGFAADPLKLRIVYDQTTYIDDAIALAFDRRVCADGNRRGIALAVLGIEFPLVALHAATMR